MASQFAGLWQDPNGFHATIDGENGTVTVQFTDVPSRPTVFNGTETDAPAGIAASFIDVDFSDAGQVIRGTLQNNGQSIVWSNNTTWTRVAVAAAAS